MVRAKIFKIGSRISSSSSQASLNKCAEMIKKGKTVVFPTETVYGLGANAFDENAIKRIYSAKGRPSDNPLIVHISDMNMLNEIVVSVNPYAKKLMKKFWPGPLTIIFRKNNIIPDIVTGKLSTVAVRMPSHPVARALIQKSGVPIAAPSANISGKPSTTTFKHVYEDLKNRVNAIIDGGDAEIGLESTVINVASKKPVLLRPGAITLEQLQQTLSKKIIVANPNAKKPISPGMKYRHYAPESPFILFYSKDPHIMCMKLKAKAEELVHKGKKIAVLGSKETMKETGCEKICDFYSTGVRGDLTTLAANIFRLLRDIDNKKYDYILMGSCSEKGIGLAIMNRLKKAASQII